MSALTDLRELLQGKGETLYMGTVREIVPGGVVVELDGGGKRKAFGEGEIGETVLIKGQTVAARKISETEVTRYV